MLTSDEVQKRNAFAACAAFRIEGLGASLDRAREIAFQGELDAVGHPTNVAFRRVGGGEFFARIFDLRIIRSNRGEATINRHVA